MLSSQTMSLFRWGRGAAPKRFSKLLLFSFLKWASLKIVREGFIYRALDLSRAMRPSRSRVSHDPEILRRRGAPDSRKMRLKTQKRAANNQDCVRAGRECSTRNAVGWRIGAASMISIIHGGSQWSRRRQRMGLPLFPFLFPEISLRFR